MVKPRHSGFTRIARATVFSWQGLRAAWRGEAAFRQESVVTLLLVPIAFLLGEDLIQTALLIGVGLILLITELLNSAIEAVVDRIGEEHHDLAGQACGGDVEPRAPLGDVGTCRHEPHSGLKSPGIRLIPAVVIRAKCS
jgi:diacylglycerol kinase (ATP)